MNKIKGIEIFFLNDEVILAVNKVSNQLQN